MILFIKKTTVVIIAIAVFLLILFQFFNVKSDDAVFVVGNHPYTVVIDAGHGGEDPGAVSDYSKASEHEIALKIAQNLQYMLENDGYSVIMTRTGDELNYTPGTVGTLAKRRQDLAYRKKIMDEPGVGAVISIHLNKFPQTKYYGAQAFYPPQAAESMKLARAIQSSISSNLDPNNKRAALEKKDTIVIFKNTKNPTVLVECGFLSNLDEEKKLRDSLYQEKIAIAIKIGLDDFFNKR